VVANVILPKTKGFGGGWLLINFGWGLAALDEIAAIVAPRLGWDDATRAREVDAYRQRAQAEFAAAEQPDDAAAQAARDVAEDLAPLLPLDADLVRPGTKPGSSPSTPATAGPAGT
jgi:glycerol-3-phosphate dehydrogenase